MPTVNDQLSLLGDPIDVEMTYTWTTVYPQTLVDPASGGPVVDTVLIVGNEVDPDDYPEITAHLVSLAWDQYGSDRYGE